MPLILLAGGPRASETFRSDDLHVTGYAVQSLQGSPDALRDEDADVVVMVHESIKGVDPRMAAAHAAWEAARDAGKFLYE